MSVSLADSKSGPSSPATAAASPLTGHAHTNGLHHRSFSASGARTNGAAAAAMAATQRSSGSASPARSPMAINPPGPVTPGTKRGPTHRRGSQMHHQPNHLNGNGGSGGSGGAALSDSSSDSPTPASSTPPGYATPTGFSFGTSLIRGEELATITGSDSSSGPSGPRGSPSPPLGGSSQPTAAVSNVALRSISPHGGASPHTERSAAASGVGQPVLEANSMAPDSPVEPPKPKEFGYDHLVDIPCPPSILEDFRFIKSSDFYPKALADYQWRAGVVRKYHLSLLSIPIGAALGYADEWLFNWKFIDIEKNIYFGREISPWLAGLGAALIVLYSAAERPIDWYWLGKEPDGKFAPEAIATVRTQAVEKLAREYRKIAFEIVDRYIDYNPLKDLLPAKIENVAEHKNGAAVPIAGSDEKGEPSGAVPGANLLLDGNSQSDGGIEVRIKFGSLEHLEALQSAFIDHVTKIASANEGLVNTIKRFISRETKIALNDEEAKRITAPMRTTFAILEGKGSIPKAKLPDADLAVISHYNLQVALAKKTSLDLRTRIKPIIADWIYDPDTKVLNRAFLDSFLSKLLMEEKFKKATVSPAQLFKLIKNACASHKPAADPKTVVISASDPPPLVLDGSRSVADEKSSVATAAAAADANAIDLNDPLADAQEVINSTLAKLMAMLEDRVVNQRFDAVCAKLNTELGERVTNAAMKQFVVGQCSNEIGKLRAELDKKLAEIGDRVANVERGLAAAVTNSDFKTRNAQLDARLAKIDEDLTLKATSVELTKQLGGLQIELNSKVTHDTFQHKFGSIEEALSLLRTQLGTLVTTDALGRSLTELRADFGTRVTPDQMNGELQALEGRVTRVLTPRLEALTGAVAQSAKTEDLKDMVPRVELLAMANRVDRLERAIAAMSPRLDAMSPRVLIPPNGYQSPPPALLMAPASIAGDGDIAARMNAHANRAIVGIGASYAQAATLLGTPVAAASAAAGGGSAGHRGTSTPGSSRRPSLSLRSPSPAQSKPPTARASGAAGSPVADRKLVSASPSPSRRPSVGSIGSPTLDQLSPLEKHVLKQAKGLKIKLDGQLNPKLLPPSEIAVRRAQMTNSLAAASPVKALLLLTDK